MRKTSKRYRLKKGFQDEVDQLLKVGETIFCEGLELHYNRSLHRYYFVIDFGSSSLSIGIFDKDPKISDYFEILEAPIFISELSSEVDSVRRSEFSAMKKQVEEMRNELTLLTNRHHATHPYVYWVNTGCSSTRNCPDGHLTIIDSRK